MRDLPDQLREFLRALRADLAEKHLLPVVVLLAAAAIGIPIAFSATAAKGPAVSSGTAPIGVTGPGAALAAVPPQPAAQTRPLGHLHDPFLGGATTTPTGAPSGPITARTGATGASGPQTPSAGTPSAGSPNKGTTPGASLKPPLSAVAARELRVYRVDYSFGQGSSVKQYNDALRLDAVPSNATPVAQFLGVTKDTRKAAFLIWGATSVSGDGVCISAQGACQIVEIKPGQTEFIDVLAPGAGIVQFELDMLAINSSEAATRADALKAHARQSADGIKVLSQSNATSLAKFEYSTVYGTLLPRTNQASSTNQANSTSAGTRGGANARPLARPSQGLGSHRVAHAHGR